MIRAMGGSAAAEEYPAEFDQAVESTDDIPLPDADISLDGSEPAADNTQRATLGGLALAAYADRVRGGDDIETSFSDMLGDLRHLADALNLNFDALSERGQMHYEAELHGEL